MLDCLSGFVIYILTHKIDRKYFINHKKQNMLPTLNITGLSGKVNMWFQCYEVLENGEKTMVKYAPRKHQICVTLCGDKSPAKIRYKHSVFQGFYYLVNPHYKSVKREEFGEILRKIGEDFNYSNVDGKVEYGIEITGETYISLLPKIINIMDQIINKLDKVAPVKGWTVDASKDLEENLRNLDVHYNLD